MNVEHLYISSGHNCFGHADRPRGHSPAVEVFQVECVAGAGIRGDRFFNFKNDYKGQVTFFSLEIYEWLSDRLQIFDKSPAVFRRNIVVSGVDLNALIDKDFTLQGITFRGTQESKPCPWMNEAFGPGAENLMMGRGGLRARVLSSGPLRRRRQAEQVPTKPKGARPKECP